MGPLKVLGATAFCFRADWAVCLLSSARLLACSVILLVKKYVTKLPVTTPTRAERALRDTPQALRLYDYLDKLDRMWRSVPDDPREARESLLAVRTLQNLISALARELGVGPLARRNLGVLTEARPMSKLEAFNAEGVQ